MLFGSTDELFLSIIFRQALCRRHTIRTMLRKLLRPGLFMLFLFGTTGVSIAQSSNWKQVKNQNKVEVYTRPVEGSKLREVKSITLVEKDRQALLKELNDYSYLANWRHKVKEMRLLEGDPMGAHYLYFAMAMPPGIQDRDFVLKVGVEQEKDLIRIPFEAIEGKLPAQDKRVRMSVMKGFWELRSVPKQEGHTQVTYQFMSDPSGIPAWIVNLFTVNAPYQALKKLRTEMMKGE